MTKDELETAHEKSSNHKEEVLASDLCGCFYCCQTFSPSKITEWIDNPKLGKRGTAICPECGIDSVIGDKSGYDILSTEFLEEMNKYWFTYPEE